MLVLFFVDWFFNVWPFVGEGWFVGLVDYSEWDFAGFGVVVEFIGEFFCGLFVFVIFYFVH